MSKQRDEIIYDQVVELMDGGFNLLTSLTKANEVTNNEIEQCVVLIKKMETLRKNIRTGIRNTNH